MPAKGRTPNPPPRRRPRVAGLNQPTRPAPDPSSRYDAPATPARMDEAPAGPAHEFEPADEFEPTQDLEPQDLEPTQELEPSRPSTERADIRPVEVIPEPAGSRRLSGALLIVVLLLVTVVGGAAALVFRGQAARAGTGSADNLAIVDTAATGEAVGQVSKAIETVLSYDYTKLDENEEAGRAVITGRYADEFGTTFADVRKTAPEQKLVLTTTVLLAGVTMLGTDRAELIATMDLAAMRDTTPYNSPGRVKVVANRVDGRWKIAEMTLL